VHAGLIPKWTAEVAATAAAVVSAALQQDPAGFLGSMYGNEPDRWRDDLARDDRLRFTLNVFTRLRYCTADGRLNLKLKCAPADAPAPWAPWFAHEGRRAAESRIVFGHWSTLGWHRSPRLLGLDTGCVWGGSLTAVDLDDPDAPPVSLGCKAWQATGAD
jgi:bis(5'-nucleosyl)-tetraphosphatase (symmetrical)